MKNIVFLILGFVICMAPYLLFGDDQAFDSPFGVTAQVVGGIIALVAVARMIKKEPNP